MVFAVVQTELPISRNFSELADVTFSFDKVSSITDGKKEIKANKVILALASEVFRAQFFGSIPAGPVVPVKDSNAEAFGIFVDILYNVKIQLKDMNLMLLGDLFYLAEKYQVDAIKAAIVEDINLREIGIENVIDVLKVVESKSHLVQFANSLYKICLKVVLKSSDNIFKVFNMSDPDDESTSRMLHRFMIKAQTLKDEENDKLCSNFKQFPCLDGSTVGLNNFVKYAKVLAIWNDGLVGDDDDLRTLMKTDESGIQIYCMEGMIYVYSETEGPEALVYNCVSKKS